MARKPEAPARPQRPPPPPGGGNWLYDPRTGKHVAVAETADAPAAPAETKD